MKLLKQVPRIRAVLQHTLLIGVCPLCFAKACAEHPVFCTGGRGAVGRRLQIPQNEWRSEMRCKKLVESRAKFSVDFLAEPQSAR